MSKYMQPRSILNWSVTRAGRCRAGYLYPVSAVPFQQSEGGILEQTITKELDQVAGRMVTEATAEVYSVAVPLAAICSEVTNNGAAQTDPYAGTDEWMREKLQDTATPIVKGSWVEREITKAMGINPRSVAGVKKVNCAAIIGHNIAVNYLRRRKYEKAAQVDVINNYDPTPALLSSTILQRLNAVLDPEDRVNGAVELTGTIPVKSTWKRYTNHDYKESTTSGQVFNDSTMTPTSEAVVNDGNGAWKYEDIWAEFGGGQQLSLKDFYRGELIDKMTRDMRAMVDANPQNGEQQVTRWAHGLEIETGKEPFLLYHKEVTFGTSMQRAMDGASLDQVRSNLFAVHDFAVPVPKNEFGMIVYTFISVKPDETIASQPTPVLSEDWGGRNFVADELVIDPVPITIRDLNAECDVADENTIACYMGNNHLRKSYISYGLTRNIPENEISGDMVVWQYELPMSVTPESVIYDKATIDDDIVNPFQAPFLDKTADVCKYTISTRARIASPIIMGPAPVEELAQIETDNIFQDAPA